jgi:hypothetical protein
MGAETSGWDEQIVRDLEAVYTHVANAVAAGTGPERTGVLNSIKVMLEPSIDAARLLVDDARA